MKHILLIIAGLFLWCGCDDDETLVATTRPEFSYQLPQGDHPYDDKIVEWHEKSGFYILYKFEPKDVFFNLDMEWAGISADTTYDQDGTPIVTYKGLSIDQPEEEYVGAQLAWVEEMFLNHYSTELLKKGLPVKLILGRNLQNHSAWNIDISYYSGVFNTLMFNYGDASIETLSLDTKKEIKDDLNMWMISDKLSTYFPDLKEFYAKTDYKRIVELIESEEYTNEAGLSLGYIEQYPHVKTVEAAMKNDLDLYLKMIIKTPLSKLEAAPIQYDWYSGMLHPDKDLKGKIKEKYELFIRIFKTWGVDLEAIGNLYDEREVLP